ncbi:hypothetical protein TOL_3723 [Thalassolituus oleivorans MIL-1]|uniref:Uncharacterized protein n=1 Tax=Thalassolituus oleivorans MIL-1 TaxID=1298593 RepID=M5EA24_9GAMM|nr:hypothetical protein TOL_3723 [Thalassolituus oleivorans MIL-1]
MELPTKHKNELTYSLVNGRLFVGFSHDTCVKNQTNLGQ